MPFPEKSGEGFLRSPLHGIMHAVVHEMGDRAPPAVPHSGKFWSSLLHNRQAPLSHPSVASGALPESFLKCGSAFYAWQSVGVTLGNLQWITSHEL